jgi:hypothetical protein
MQALTLGIGSLLIAACGSARTPFPASEPTITPESALAPPKPTAEPPIPSATPQPTIEPTKSPNPITTLEQMTGIWLRTFKGYEYKLEVDKEGGVRVKVMFINPQEFWFEDEDLHVKAAEDFPECPAGTEGVYTVSGVPENYLVFALVEDPCIGTRGFRGTWQEASSQSP